jgi:drug/metabolite transporter (DMT)-like permease
MKETNKGALYIVLSMVIFGTNGLFVKHLSQNYGISPISIVFQFFLIPAAILSLFFLFKDRSVFKIDRVLWFILLFAVIDIIHVFFYLQAFINTTISNAVLTHYTAPIFLAIFAPLIIKENINKKIIYALITGTIGIFFIMYGNFSIQSQDFIGILFGLASGLMYAFAIIIIKIISKKTSIYRMRIYHSIIGAVILIPIVANTNLFESIKMDPIILIIFLFYSVLLGVIGILLHWNGIKMLSSHKAGILGYVEPLFATIFAIIFLSEIPSLNTILGGLLILFSGYLIIRRRK